MHYAINLLQTRLDYKEVELALLRDKRYCNDAKQRLGKEIAELKQAIDKLGESK